VILPKVSTNQNFWGVLAPPPPAPLSPYDAVLFHRRKVLDCILKDNQQPRDDAAWVSEEVKEMLEKGELEFSRRSPDGDEDPREKKIEK